MNNPTIIYQTIRQKNEEAREELVQKIMTWLVDKVSHSVDHVFIYDFGQRSIPQSVMSLIRSRYPLLMLQTKNGRHIKKSYVNRFLASDITTYNLLPHVTQIMHNLVDNYHNGLCDYTFVVDRLSTFIEDDPNFNDAFDTFENSLLIIDISNVVG
jgi:hypothetical protein